MLVYVRNEVMHKLKKNLRIVTWDSALPGNTDIISFFVLHNQYFHIGALQLC